MYVATGTQWVVTGKRGETETVFSVVNRDEGWASSFCENERLQEIKENNQEL